MSEFWVALMALGVWLLPMLMVFLLLAWNDRRQRRLRRQALDRHLRSNDAH